jgi:hypothetical protein
MGIARNISLAPAAPSANNIAQSQSPGAGAITLNGSTVSGGVATLDIARRILLTSGTSDTGITFTITGTSRYGTPLTETIQGGATTAQTTQDFKTVSSVTHTGSVAGTLTIGTSGVVSSEWIAITPTANPVNIGIGVVVSGTINYTVEYTYDDLQNPTSGLFPTAWSITSGTLTAKAANGDTGANPFNFPISALRLTVNSFTNPGNVKMTVIQSGAFS